MKKITIIMLLLGLSIFPETGLSAESGPNRSINPVRIVVIPFENATGDPTLEWLSLGLQEAMTVDLSYLEGVETFSYGLELLLGGTSIAHLTKLSKNELLELGKKMELHQIWIGRYRGRADRITLEISVMDVLNGNIIAAKQVSAPIKQLLSAESKTVVKIAKEAGISITDIEAKRILSRKTESPAVFRLNALGYAKLEELFEVLKSEDENKKNEIRKEGKKLLEEAVAADRNYAEAWCNLGWIDILLNQGGAETRGALGKALKIKPFLINANVGMGLLHRSLANRETGLSSYYWLEPEKALGYFREGLKLNPSLTINSILLGMFLAEQKRNVEAAALFAKIYSRASNTLKPEIIDFLGYGMVKDKRIMAILIEALQDPDEEMCRQALSILGTIGDSTAVPPLVKLLKHPDKGIRSNAALVLGNLGIKTALPAILQALKDPAEEVRMYAAGALGQIGNKTVLPVLIEALRDPAKRVRQHAAFSFGNIKDKSAVPALIDSLKDDDKDVRSAAANALRQIKDKRAVPALIRALKDPDKYVSYNAISALEAIKDKSAVLALKEALNEPDKSFQIRIARALCSMGEESGMTILLNALNDQDREIRETAIFAIVKIRGNGAVPILLNILKDPDKGLRSHAIVFLMRINDENVVPGLIEALKDSEESIQNQAAMALAQIGDPKAAPFLKELLNSRNALLRLSAAMSLAKMGDKTHIPLLLDGLKDPELNIRFQAALLLGELWDKRSSPFLIEIMEKGDQYGLEPEFAAEILGKLGEAALLVESFSKNREIFIFNQLRKIFLFPENIAVLTRSSDYFVKAAGFYISALKAREEGDYKTQLESAVKAMSFINPQSDTALYILCLWLKEQAELKLDLGEDAKKSIAAAEGYLDYLSSTEIYTYEDNFRGLTKFLKGEVYSSTNDTKNALAAYEESLEDLEEWKIKHQGKEAADKLEVMVRTGLGVLQIKMGKENLVQAVETGRNYQANDSVEMENEEKRYLELSRQKIAEGNYEEAQRLIEELNLRRTNYINRRTKINLADKDKQASIDAYRKKQQQIDSLSKQIETLVRKKNEPSAGEPSQGEEEIKKLETERNNRRRELQVYFTSLKKTHSDIAALLGAKPIELATIQEQLPEDMAVLQYLLLPDKLVVFVIKKDGIEIIETATIKIELKDKIASLRRAICAITEGKDSKKITPLSIELYNMLVKPVEEAQHLKGIKILGIAPNGFLHQLPFGVLKNSQDQYLIDRYTLFYINSTSLLGVALDRGKETTKGEKALLALNNPDGSLPAADIEVADIAKYFNKKQIYSRKEAKKSIIQTGKKDYTILHLSTHGTFDPLDSTKNHLLMADGDLTMEEIWGLPLKGVSLTVLSACDTGLGEVLSGDDVVSLENAFIYAGSSTVVATLWKVADQSTAELMALFYRNLSKGMIKAEALSQAPSGEQARHRSTFPAPFLKFRTSGFPQYGFKPEFNHDLHP